MECHCPDCQAADRWELFWTLAVFLLALAFIVLISHFAQPIKFPAPMVSRKTPKLAIGGPNKPAPSAASAALGGGHMAWNPCMIAWAGPPGSPAANAISVTLFRSSGRCAGFCAGMEHSGSI
jgi:hypothetical protein